MSKKVLIIGAGEFGQQVALYIREQGEDSVFGFLDDTKEVDSMVLDFPVVGSFRDYSKFPTMFFFVALGYKHLDKKNMILEELISHNFKLYSYIHSSAYISPFSTLGRSVFIFPKVIIDKNVKIGDGVVINLGSIVSHDSSIESCAFIAPGVIISGFVKLGYSCFLGSGSVLKDNISVTSKVIVGAGAVVVSNISKEGVYFGVPAKIR